MSVYCQLCGAEFSGDPDEDCGLAWCDCADGIVATAAEPPARHA